MKNQSLVNMPIPYGTIPKHKMTEKYNKLIQEKTPYPFFTSTPSSSFIAFLYKIFKTKNQQEHIGFMPCTTSFTSNTQTSPLDIIVPVTPMDCNYTGRDENYDNSSLSTSSGSSHSDWSLSSLDMEYAEEDDTSATLSDILCEHHVQTKMQSSSHTTIDIPLDTFRMFEAPSLHKEHWSITSLLDEPKDWTLIVQQKEEKKKEKPMEIPVLRHTRDVRSNTAYLRMVVAEVNMMRAEKIVGPLRQRRVLAKRVDSFMHKPSPLSQVC